MSRPFSSGAEEAADRLCEKLGLRVFDKTLMMRVAAEVGLAETQIVDYTSKRAASRLAVMGPCAT